MLRRVARIGGVRTFWLEESCVLGVEGLKSILNVLCERVWTDLFCFRMGNDGGML